MKSSYKFEKNYKDNEKLRNSFNELAENTFGGLNFEKWYQSGYWQEKYIPYSIIDGESVVANVSVNSMDFYSNGKLKHYVQIGTVMTNEKYRNQGLNRFLIETLIKDYKDSVDTFYLWANDSVIDFYPKFGFRTKKEFQYRKAVHYDLDRYAQRVLMNSDSQRKVLEMAISKSAVNSRFEMNNIGLTMFYIVYFMENCVYYIRGMDTYVIAEMNESKLIIHNVITPEVVDLEQVIKAFGREVETVILGFTPIDNDGYEVFEINEDDRTFFVMGKDFEHFENEFKMFPTLSHA